MDSLPNKRVGIALKAKRGVTIRPFKIQRLIHLIPLLSYCNQIDLKVFAVLVRYRARVITRHNPVIVPELIPRLLLGVMVLINARVLVI